MIALIAPPSQTLAAAIIVGSILLFAGLLATTTGRRNR